MTITKNDIRAGSTIMVRGEWGKAAPQMVKVTSIWSRDPSHSRIDGQGSHCIDYKTDSGSIHWAFMHQIDYVVDY